MIPQPLAVVLGLATAVMLCGWLVQERKPNPHLAGLLWAACISFSALYYGVVAPGALMPRLLVAMMGGIGGFRLFMHILQRMLAVPPDARPRREGGSVRRLGLFVLTGLSVAAFSLPLYVAASNPDEQATAWTVLGAIVYLTGLSGETYADIQLVKFRDAPRHRGRVCRRGLWRTSRHPNHFFAFVRWCGYPLLAIGLPWPMWALTLIGPALAAFVGYLRAMASERRAEPALGEAYRVYQRTTSAFVPWPPQRDPGDAPPTASWYTPPSATTAAVSTKTSTRGTPLPGARITPMPSSRPLTGPTTPRPERPLSERDGAKKGNGNEARVAAGDVDT
jgi:steroid 5-alpha reductase family enzyme